MLGLFWDKLVVPSPWYDQAIAIAFSWEQYSFRYSEVIEQYSFQEAVIGNSICPENFIILYKQVVWKVLSLLRSLQSFSSIQLHIIARVGRCFCMKSFNALWCISTLSRGGGGGVTLVVDGYGIEIGLSSDCVRLHLLFSLTHFRLGVQN